MWRPSIRPSQVLIHSAKGSEWEDHMYVKKVDGKYYYPNGYNKGRTISDLSPSDKDNKIDETKTNSYSYSKDDSDFDKSNYSNKNLLGDTNFYGFKNKDGKTVVLNEDMKWTLPKGTELNSKLISKLEKVDREIEKRIQKGEKIDADEIDRLVQDAIDDEKSSSSTKSSGKSSKSKSSKSGKSSYAEEKARKAKNKATMKARNDQQIKNKQKRMRKNSLDGKSYLNHSGIWGPTISSDYIYSTLIERRK